MPHISDWGTPGTRYSGKIANYPSKIGNDLWAYFQLADSSTVKIG